MVGLLLLLAAADQHKLIARVGQALKPGGRWMRVIDSYVDDGDNYYFQASSCGR